MCFVLFVVFSHIQNVKISRKFFHVSILSTTRNGFSLLSGCQREFFFSSFCFVEMSFLPGSVKSPEDKSRSSSRQTAISQIAVVLRHSRNHKSHVLSLENLRGIVRRAKVGKSANSVVTDSSGSVAKADSSSKILHLVSVCLFIFYYAA